MPLPKHPSKRLGHRSSTGEPWRELPATGRQGPPPPWPLSTPPTVEHASFWAQLWNTPQAVVWEEQHLERQVARYVLHAVSVETADARVRMVSEVRQAEAALLLTPGALARARYTIAEPAEVVPMDAADADERKALRERRRLMAVDQRSSEKGA